MSTSVLAGRSSPAAAFAGACHAEGGGGFEPHHPLLKSPAQALFLGSAVREVGGAADVNAQMSTSPSGLRDRPEPSVDGLGRRHAVNAASGIQRTLVAAEEPHSGEPASACGRASDGFSGEGAPASRDDAAGDEVGRNGRERHRGRVHPLHGLECRGSIRGEPVGGAGEEGKKTVRPSSNSPRTSGCPCAAKPFKAPRGAARRGGTAGCCWRRRARSGNPRRRRPRR